MASMPARSQITIETFLPNITAFQAEDAPSLCPRNTRSKPISHITISASPPLYLRPLFLNTLLLRPLIGGITSPLLGTTGSHSLELKTSTFTRLFPLATPIAVEGVDWIESSPLRNTDTRSAGCDVRILTATALSVFGISGTLTLLFSGISSLSLLTISVQFHVWKIISLASFSRQKSKNEASIFSFGIVNPLIRTFRRRHLIHSGLPVTCSLSSIETYWTSRTFAGSSHNTMLSWIERTFLYHGTYA
jgi:hypothetical protein